eukprot:CAMPEP_0113969046 /NCGR_PEP_ID=MMETSP0011_2-20120614/9974_1 /TAXON_ID=101924 /ORGANISM="Rhodosorus marinus" /LENGTH=612 /DNA_ID=CAMNT_0000982409 /DNA_START=573 /DNA_END=2411 /DNA_ORIENTATION=+ /assembly_acc=CAM_ASM_000156
MASRPIPRFQVYTPRTGFRRENRSSRERKMTRASLHLLETYRQCSPGFRYSTDANPRRVLTTKDSGVLNNGYDNEDFDYILHANDVLSSPEGDDYIVIELLGTGTFGQVVKCRHLSSGQCVAIKVIKNSPAYFRQAQMEVKILQKIHRDNSAEDVRHIVMLLGHFEFRNHLCLVFEKLSINLFDLIKQNKFRGLGLGLLLSFVKQILTTLEVLQRSGIIHCDLKPENILLQDINSTVIKVIDFGSACLDDQVVYSYVQSRFYRSPEVLLSMRYDSKIDMWSLGCIAGELFLGLPLFPGDSEENMVYRIIEMIDCPAREMLVNCAKATTYFNISAHAGEPVFVLKSEEQLARERGVEYTTWTRYFPRKMLIDIVRDYPYRAHATRHDVAVRECFADFIIGLLQIDPQRRWTPSEALRHPFIQGRLLGHTPSWNGRGGSFPPPARDSVARSYSGEVQNGAQAQGSSARRGQRSIKSKVGPSGSVVKLPKTMQGDDDDVGAEIKFGSYSPSPYQTGSIIGGSNVSESRSSRDQDHAKPTSGTACGVQREYYSEAGRVQGSQEGTSAIDASFAAASFADLALTGTAGALESESTAAARTLKAGSLGIGDQVERRER